MTLTARPVASGQGWCVHDFVCTAGPRDRPYEERHEAVSISAVTAGTFRYRTASGSAMLAPGALLLGNRGQCYECGHEHGIGDRCLSFQFDPDWFEAVAAGVPRVRRASFGTPHLPPIPALLPLLAAAEAARDTGAAILFDELALRLAGAVLATLAGAAPDTRAPTAHEARRIADIVRLIAADADEQLALADLAGKAAMSQYHFLRTFRAVVGMTPHQYVLRTRLHRAAVRLRRSDDPVAAIAFGAGFNDLSTFNRRFRRLMGTSPTAWRAAGSARQRAAAHQELIDRAGALPAFADRPHH
jgi:AraC family transcriptional regulator